MLLADKGLCTRVLPLLPNCPPSLRQPHAAVGFLPVNVSVSYTVHVCGVHTPIDAHIYTWYHLISFKTLKVYCRLSGNFFSPLNVLLRMTHVYF